MGRFQNLRENKSDYLLSRECIAITVDGSLQHLSSHTSLVPLTAEARKPKLFPPLYLVWPIWGSRSLLKPSGKACASLIKRTHELASLLSPFFLPGTQL